MRTHADDGRAAEVLLVFDLLGHIEPPTALHSVGRHTAPLTVLLFRKSRLARKAIGSELVKPKGTWYSLVPMSRMKTSPLFMDSGVSSTSRTKILRRPLTWMSRFFCAPAGDVEPACAFSALAFCRCQRAIDEFHC